MSTTKIKKVKCESCNGTYEPIQQGIKYYHRCPEKTNNPRNENLGKDGKIMSEGQGVTEAS